MGVLTQLIPKPARNGGTVPFFVAGGTAPLSPYGGTIPLIPDRGTIPLFQDRGIVSLRIPRWGYSTAQDRQMFSRTDSSLPSIRKNEANVNTTLTSKGKVRKVGHDLVRVQQPLQQLRVEARPAVHPLVLERSVETVGIERVRLLPEVWRPVKVEDGEEKVDATSNLRPETVRAA